MKRAVSGLRAWLWQRLSAITLLGFLVFLFAHLLLGGPHTYHAWRTWVLGPWTRIAFVVFFAALLVHIWVGVRDVLLDYVHPFALRMTALAVLAVSLLATAAWAGAILLG